MGLFLWIGPRLTYYKHTLPHADYHVECDRCWSNGTSVSVRRSAEKKLDFSYPAFRGQSKSSEQTRIGYTYDSLLTFVTSTGRLLYRFQDIARY